MGAVGTAWLSLATTRFFCALISTARTDAKKKVLYTPQDKLLTCLVSIMSGCQAICRIDTRIRPDRALAQAWGLERFAQQSTVADTLNKIMPMPGKVMFEDDQLVKARLQATHPLAKPVLVCLSRILAEF